jgi:hypothetical protein
MIDMGLPIAKDGAEGRHVGPAHGPADHQGHDEDGRGAVWVQQRALGAVSARVHQGLYSPTNRNVSPPPDVAAKLIMGEKVVDAIKEAPWAVLLPQRDALLDKWTREFGG